MNNNTGRSQKQYVFGSKKTNRHDVEKIVVQRKYGLLAWTLVRYAPYIGGGGIGWACLNFLEKHYVEMGKVLASIIHFG